MENTYFEILGHKIPTMVYLGLFPFYLVTRRARRSWRVLFRNRTFVSALGYLGILVVNALFVLKDLFWRPDKYTNSLWLSTFGRIIFVLLIFWVFEKERDVIKLVAAYGLGLALSALSSYPAMFLLHHYIFNSNVTVGNEGYQRAMGFFLNPNLFGLSVTYLILVLLYLYFSGTVRNVIVLIISFILFPPLLLSYSRVAWLSLCFGAIVLFLTYSSRKRKAQLVFGMLLIVGSLAFILLHDPATLHRIDDATSGGSAYGRLISISAAYEHWIYAPWFGIGAYKTQTLPSAGGLSIHSFYLQALFETGIVGFVITMYMLAEIYMGFRRIKGSRFLSKQARSFCELASVLIVTYYFAIILGNQIQDDFFWYLIAAQLVFSKSIMRKRSLELLERSRAVLRHADTNSHPQALQRKA